MSNFNSVLFMWLCSATVFTLAAIGIVGVGTNSMPFSITPVGDGPSVATSTIGCHDQSIRMAENTRENSLGKSLNYVTGTSYRVDESSMGLIGCFLFGNNQRTWVAMQPGSGWSQYMTPGLCALSCHDAGFVYAIVWYFTYCWCADVIGGSTTVAYGPPNYQPVSDIGRVSNSFCEVCKYFIQLLFGLKWVL